MHQHESGLLCTALFAYREGMTATGRILADQKWKEYRSGGPNTVTADIWATLPSGRGDTTLTNSCTVDLIAIVIVLRGYITSQLIQNTFWNFGFKSTCDEVDMDARPLACEFLQQRFYLTYVQGVEMRVPGNRIGRILFKTFWTKDNLSPEKRKGLIRGIALGLANVNNHVPILNDLIQRLLYLTSDSTVYYDQERLAERRWRSLEDASPTPALPEHPSTLYEISMEIGITLPRLVEFRRSIHHIELFELWGCDFPDVLQAFISWDL